MAGVLGDRVIYIPIEPRQNQPDPKATANEQIVCRTFATTRNIKDPGSYRAGRTRRKSARSTGFRGPVSRPRWLFRIVVCSRSGLATKIYVNERFEWL